VNIISDKPKAGVAERRDRRVVMLCLLMGFSNVVSSVQTPWLASAAVKFGAADGQTLEPVEGHVQGQLLRDSLNHEVVMPSRKVHHFTLKTQAFRAARASFAPTDAVPYVRVFPGLMSSKLMGLPPRYCEPSSRHCERPLRHCERSWQSSARTNAAAGSPRRKLLAMTRFCHCERSVPIHA
jgi:hypothetical protein